MLGFILRVVLFFLTLRFVLGLVGYLVRLAGRREAERLDEDRAAREKGDARPAEKPIVDRSSAIDVPFTEE